MRHSNIAVFVPHEGCPHTCSFCNQRSISGTQTAPRADEVAKICSKAIAEIEDRKGAEIAFFGGSFTAIERGYMLSLLEAADEFVGEGKFSGIRISTRPDAVDDEILAILKRFHVTTIELGAQSMNDAVLQKNERGHTAADVKSAANLICKNGFRLGLQMMVGLYESTPALDKFTAEELIKLSPSEVRIYPTVILKGTRLAERFWAGEYVPMTLDAAVDLCAWLLKRFDERGIPVIKLGLHASQTVEDEMVGGLYHPAFRELCEGILYRERIEKLLEKSPFQREVYVPQSDLSKAIGQKKSNIIYFKNKGIDIKILPICNLK